MKKISAEIKHMLNALANANAGENLSLRQKSRLMAGTPAPATTPVADAPTPVRPQVALYMGSEIPADVMNYVVQTCARLRHGLTVLTFQTEDEAQGQLAPYQAALDENGTAVRVTHLLGDPPTALARALRRLPEVAFLVCNESGYLGHGLLNGTQRKDGLPVPVVLVAANGKSSALPGDLAQDSRSTRAA